MRLALLIVVSLAACLSPRAKADLTVGPVQWTTAEGGNGDYYELVLPDSSANSYSWTEARQAADSMTYQGLQGYLATVTSQAENDFLGANFSSYLHDSGAIPGGPVNSTY